MPHKDPDERRQYGREWMRERYQDPDYKKKHLEMVKRSRDRSRQRAKLLVRQFRAGGCSACDEKEPCCLDAHHTDPDKKDFSLGDGVRRLFSVKRLRAEFSKCICVCKNCHAKIHGGILACP